MRLLLKTLVPKNNHPFTDEFKARGKPRAIFVSQIDLYTIVVYIELMHVIAKTALVTFWTKHPDSRVALTAWYKIIQDQDFASFAELRKTFASADHVKGLTVFNIAGSKYRLIAAVHYNRRKVFIRHILTHAEYDLGKWKSP